MNVGLKICVALTACLAFTATNPGALAQNFSSSDGDIRDANTLSVQQKAEELFEREDYKRAHFIYRKELVPIGDKYAQYMVGFMTLTGLGVREDPVLASAWYRLAAERDIPEFIAVRDDLIRRLDTVDMDRSDEIYLRLRRQYSDIVLRMSQVRKDFERLRGSSTGSRIGMSSAPVIIVNPGDGTGISADAYENRLRMRMQGHLNFIARTLEIEPVDADITARELAKLETRVEDFVARIDDR